MTADDQAREDRINLMIGYLQNSQDHKTAYYLWLAIKIEIAKRSPEQVARMETEKGLI